MSRLIVKNLGKFIQMLVQHNSSTCFLRNYKENVNLKEKRIRLIDNLSQSKVDL